MLADTFLPRKLGVAMGVFNMGHTYDIRIWLSKQKNARFSIVLKKKLNSPAYRDRVCGA